MKNFIKRIIFFLEAIFSKKDDICPFCRCPNFKVVHKKAGIIDICLCGQCGLHWTNPIFRLPGFYEFLCYDEPRITYQVLKGKELEKAKAALFKGTGRDYSFFIDWLEKDIQGKTLLEFGSSWGYFLYQAKNRGFEVTGVEISEKRRNFGIEHLKVPIVANLDLLLSEKRHFDIIVTFHTLEHLTNIYGIFTCFQKLLNKGGTLIISVPFLDDQQNEKRFTIMGATHPLGFTRDFFMKNLPAGEFKLSFHDNMIIAKKIEMNGR